MRYESISKCPVCEIFVRDMERHVRKKRCGMQHIRLRQKLMEGLMSDQQIKG